MAPVKFGLFKARSRDYQEQPSTENLLHTSNSSDQLATPNSPIASTSKGFCDDQSSTDLSNLHLGVDEDTISVKSTPIRRPSESSTMEEAQIKYQQLKNETSTDATSTSNFDFEQIESSEDIYAHNHDPIDLEDGASTSCDANSLQFDITSLAASEDLSVYCGALKKPKKSRSKEEQQQIRDYDMWRASNYKVMENLLSRSGTVDDQMKWEAIATARGLCTLTDSCTCGDCVRAKYLTGIADGDGGLGAAPLFSAINVGCQVQ